VSQAEAQEYRRNVWEQLDEELVAHDRTTCTYCTAGMVCLEVDYAERAAEIVERRMQREPRGPAGRTAAEDERMSRAVRGALEGLAARQARPNGSRPRNQRSWPELQNDLHNTL
jgi:aerobic-type carbon monoxide dehydrogenase small subunit (CoxS/CutS family)